ncbi:MAG: hypothetical protein LUG85_02060 [Clostridiales bacterium]|nr:hypothetical protein [Clostridiales bacterium]MCD7827309.1 hypothetical protein [Clostridiales bacterium]
MKKITALIITLLLALGLCACTSSDGDEESTAESASETVSAVSSDSDSEKVTGTLYGVMASETRTNEFSFYGGTYTPERIAAGMTGWSGLKFRITAETDTDGKTVKIDWSEESAFYTGDYSEANSGFTFESAEELRTFMMDSMTKTIQENMGDYSVYFTVNGEDIGTVMDGLSSENAYEIVNNS